jgi:hypothetical protein
LTESARIANEKYDKVVAQIINERDVTHSISSDQASKLISEAGRQRDETIRAAQVQKDEVISKLKQLNSESVSQVNQTTGEIKGFWQRLSDWWRNLLFPNKTMTVTTKYQSINVDGKTAQVPKGNGSGGDTFKVPKMAEGGFVTSPTFALIGEAGAEAVIPLKYWKSMVTNNGGRGGGGGIVVNVTGNSINSNIDIDIIAQRLVQKLKTAGVY